MLSVSIVSSLWHNILELLCPAGMVHQLCHSVYQLQQLTGTSKRRIQLSLQLHNQLCAVIPNNTILMTLDLSSQQRLSTNQLTKEESSIKSTKYTSLQMTNLSKKRGTIEWRPQPGSFGDSFLYLCLQRISALCEKHFSL